MSEYETIRLADRLGIIAIDGTDYGEEEREVTRVATDLLADAVDMVQTLGYDEVDVVTVDGAERPMLLLRPTENSLFADSTAALAIAPRIPGDHDE